MSSQITDVPLTHHSPIGTFSRYPCLLLSCWAVYSLLNRQLCHEMAPSHAARSEAARGKPVKTAHEHTGPSKTYLAKIQEFTYSHPPSHLPTKYLNLPLTRLPHASSINIHLIMCCLCLPSMCINNCNTLYSNSLYLYGKPIRAIFRQ